MLGIKRETDYAVRTVLHLASVGEGAHVQVRDVAAHRLLPLSFVRRIVARLRSAGILTTTRGMGGGIKLARPASEISLLDVVLAMEESLALNRCLDAEHTCPLAGSCPAQRAWGEATAVLAAHLAEVRFDALSGSVKKHVDAHRGITGGKAAKGTAGRPRKSRRSPRPVRS